MFNKHLFKVIIGFCGMILFGLITLVVFDYFKDTPKEVPVTDQSTIAEAVGKPAPKSPVKQTPKKVSR